MVKCLSNTHNTVFFHIYYIIDFILSSIYQSYLHFNFVVGNINMLLINRNQLMCIRHFWKIVWKINAKMLWDFRYRYIFTTCCSLNFKTLNFGLTFFNFLYFRYQAILHHKRKNDIDCS